MVTHPDLRRAAAGARARSAPTSSPARQARTASSDLYEYPGGKTIPRTDVTFDEAQRLCALRWERLCTRDRVGARVPRQGRRELPVWRTYETARCNTKGAGSGETPPAGSFKDCRSAAGAYDMTGNVAEWVTSDRPGAKGRLGPRRKSVKRAAHIRSHGVPHDGRRARRFPLLRRPQRDRWRCLALAKRSRAVLYRPLPCGSPSSEAARRATSRTSRRRAAGATRVLVDAGLSKSEIELRLRRVPDRRR